MQTPAASTRDRRTYGKRSSKSQCKCIRGHWKHCTECSRCHLLSRYGLLVLFHLSPGNILFPSGLQRNIQQSISSRSKTKAQWGPQSENTILTWISWDDNIPVRCLSSLPVIGFPLRNHSTKGSGTPVPAQWNTPVCPTVRFWLTGFSIHSGAAVKWTRSSATDTAVRIPPPFVSCICIGTKRA